jgi:polar amino acid transport system substrate-binding protein
MTNAGRALALMLLSLTMVACAPSVDAETIKACADQIEMPPFSYAERVDGRKTQHVVGASIDLLKQIGQARGWTIQIQLLPWARCLALVANGDFQLAINTDETDAQANNLLVSESYFTLHSVYFYSRQARPQGLALNNLADIKHYRLCGFSGYRFEMFGIDTGKVDRGTSAAYEPLIAKLHLGRCDLFIDSRETMAGQYLINPKLRTLLANGTLISQPLPGSPKRDLHFAVSASSSKSSALLVAINEGMESLEKSKTMENLLNHYLE